MIKRRANPRRTKTFGDSRHKHRLNIEYVPIGTPIPAVRNSRTHSQKQTRQLAESIRQFGFNNPIIVDEQNRIIAGHGRKLAAEFLGMVEVPIIRMSDLTPAQLRAYMLADNKLAEMAGWDRDLLRIELSELAVLLPQIDLDLSITGFEPAEVDSILVDFESNGSGPADDIPAVEKVSVAQPGDLFRLGRHRLLVGDARRPESFSRLMANEAAMMAILDPPYNVRISDVGGRGRIKHREFMIASGELSPEQFIEFLKEGLRLCAMYSVDGAIHFVFMDWRHARELLAAGEAIYSELKNICVWTKNIAGQGSFYRSQHEFVFVFKCGSGPHVNNFELGQHGRTRSNVWPYSGVNSFRAGRLDELEDASDR